MFSILISNTVNVGSYNIHINKSSLGFSIIFKFEGFSRQKYLRTVEPNFLAVVCGTYKGNSQECLWGKLKVNITDRKMWLRLTQSPLFCGGVR